MMRIRVYGAGAIGRGFLPWVFKDCEFEFVDPNVNLKRDSYTTYMTSNGYRPLKVQIHGADKPDVIFCCVGTRNCTKIADEFRNPAIPVYVCENDSRVVPVLREMTGNDNIWFAIPDVITSNTAPETLLHVDPLAVVTEEGCLYMPFGSKLLSGGNYLSPEMMYKQWIAKLYLHNTPHCIAAYHGWLKGYTYMSECMDDPKIKAEVEGVLNECIQMVTHQYGLNRKFAEFYAEKEIRRFSNVFLHDPITRVAREPLRKLGEGERLVGAARLCIQSNIVPEHIIRGIKACQKYDNPDDPDHGKSTARNEFIAIDEPLWYLMDEPWGNE
jgi:mannitol-1-phosphate 5-dehydrogenase